MTKTRWQALLGVMFLSCVLVWMVALWVKPDGIQVIACDVGQGDAFLMIQGSTQVLIDAGTGKNIVECLDKYIPFWDRNIEIAIITHPQTDHYGGFVDVLQHYYVENMLISGLESGSQKHRLLEKLVGGRGTEVYFADTVSSMRSGSIYLDILHPAESYITSHSDKIFDTRTYGLSAFTSKEDPNLFSVVVLATYKNFDALFTGDIDPSVSDLVADKLPNRKVEYLKVPHHGSKNGMSELLLRAVNPDLAVISASKNNSYGHPHKQILEMLGRLDIKTLRTDVVGDIVVESDGSSVWTR